MKPLAEFMPWRWARAPSLLERVRRLLHATAWLQKDNLRLP